MAAGAGLALLLAASGGLRAHAGPPAVDASAAPAPAPAASPLVAQARRGQVSAARVEDVEPMCALLTSCDRLPIPASLFPADFQACVNKISEELASPAAVKFSLTMRECGLRADSCASLRACALRGAGEGACRGRGRQGVVGLCDLDGRALTCWHDEVLAVRDCTRGDEQCIVVDGQATCTLGACSAASEDADRPRCSGSGRHLLRCEKGKLASLDCAAFGLTCVNDASGAAGCATSGPPCSGSARRCDGAVAVGCYNGHEVRVDCAAGGLACAAPLDAPASRGDGGAPRAQAVGACVTAPVAGAGGCDPLERARCDGDTIRYCYEGRPRSYSCAALGFGRCVAGAAGVRCAN
ncbi:MAG: hypothetical protein JOZ69_16835 [Myxococcales bacterium]|nr:hypothetical protein [Myxococcales bacterium]